jgi:ABC-type sugar transport system ATPase subunit
VRKPRVFLLDEPLSNLDANLRVAMRQELKRLHELLGATFIYVTHDQDDALAMGDRVLVLSEGRLQQYDAATRVYHYPANRFVASFLGRLPMNFFSGTLTRAADRLIFRNEDLAIPCTGLDSLRDGAPATLGVRPDAVLARPGEGGDQAVQGNVQWLEVVQPDLFATVRVGKHSVIAKVPEDVELQVEDRVGLSFTAGKLHLFDPSNGERLNPALEEQPASSALPKRASA